MGKLTKRQARRWVREHWATFMWHADCPGGNVPDEVAEVFDDESRRLAHRIMPYDEPRVFTDPAGRAALSRLEREG